MKGHHDEKAYSVQSTYPGKKKKLRGKKKSKKKCLEIDIVISVEELAVHLITFKPMSLYYKL